MRIFTSWSGDRSKTAALGLKSLLQDLFEEAVQVFVSDHITPGEAWAQRIGTELEQSEFGILCLTRDNWQSSWLLFEAGAIAKKFASSRVVPYLIDELPPAAERSPLAQFQHVRADREGTYRLVESINTIRESPKPSDRLERSFTKWWPDLEQTLKALQASNATQPALRTDRDLLEAILQRVEGLSRARNESRVELSPIELTHLRNLRDHPELAYKLDPNLQKELRHLRDLGLIKNRKPIADLPPNFQLGQHFDLTVKGKDHLQSIVPLPEEQTGTP
ncbi:MAG: TIR domain-containing protein [Silvibacterium sp.]